MKIAIDYDKTWNAQPGTFFDIAEVFHFNLNEVYVVTARSATKDNILELDKDTQSGSLLEMALSNGIVKKIIYADGVAKRWALHHYHDLDIDIWIDDKPDNILNNSTATKPVLEEWRTNGRV